MGGPQALSQAITELKVLIHDISAVRQRAELLEDTNANAHSALNSTEHTLGETRSAFERLVAAIATHAEHRGAPTVADLRDRKRPTSERSALAGSLIAELLAQAGGTPEEAAEAEAAVGELERLRQRLSERDADLTRAQASSASRILALEEQLAAAKQLAPAAAPVEPVSRSEDDTHAHQLALAKTELERLHKEQERLLGDLSAARAANKAATQRASEAEAAAGAAEQNAAAVEAELTALRAEMQSHWLALSRHQRSYPVRELNTWNANSD